MVNATNISTNSKLWDEFVSGSDDAYKTIYDSNVQLLYKYGLHFTQDEDLLQDCIHDLFIDLHKYRSKLKRTNNIKLYLFTSLKRKIIKVLGKERRIQKLNSEAFSFIYVLYNETESEKEEKVRRLELLEKAMLELSNRQREAIYLKFVSELSYEELSDVLQMNYQSARNLIFRGIEKLRESCKNNTLLLVFAFFNANFCSSKQVFTRR